MKLKVTDKDDITETINIPFALFVLFLRIKLKNGDIVIPVHQCFYFLSWECTIIVFGRAVINRFVF